MAEQEAMKFRNQFPFISKMVDYYRQGGPMGVRIYKNMLTPVELELLRLEEEQLVQAFHANSDDVAATIQCVLDL